MAQIPIQLPSKEQLEKEAIKVAGGSKDINELPRKIRATVQEIVVRLKAEKEQATKDEAAALKKKAKPKKVAPKKKTSKAKKKKGKK